MFSDIEIFRKIFVVRIFILLPAKIYSDLMNLKVGGMQLNLSKCNNVYVIIIPQIDAMKVSLSSINVFFFARNNYKQPLLMRQSGSLVKT